MVKHPRQILSFSVLALGLGWCATTLPATQPVVNSRSLASNTNNNNKTTEQKRAAQKTAGNRTAVDTDAEAKATRLVQMHLPSLKEILRRLRESEPREYARAIQDLSRSARKLELAEGRADGSYDVELELLKSQTQVNLFTARLRVRDDARDRKKLKAAIERLQQAQVARAQFDVQLLRTRLARTQKQLDQAEQRLQSKQDNFDEQIEKTYSSLLRKAGRDNSDRDQKSSRTKEERPRNSNTENPTRDSKK